MIDVKKVEDFEKLTTALNGITEAIENMPTPTGGGIDYSTEEQNTGLKWIDGRTIYQKTIITPFSTSSATSFLYTGSFSISSFFPDITDWANSYFNMVSQFSYLTLNDGTVRNVVYCDFQNVPSIGVCFFYASRTGTLTLTVQYVKGDDLI